MTVYEYIPCVPKSVYKPSAAGYSAKANQQAHVLSACRMSMYVRILKLKPAGD